MPPMTTPLKQRIFGNIIGAFLSTARLGRARDEAAGAAAAPAPAAEPDLDSAAVLLVALGKVSVGRADDGIKGGGHVRTWARARQGADANDDGDGRGARQARAVRGACRRGASSLLAESPLPQTLRGRRPLPQLPTCTPSSCSTSAALSVVRLRRWRRCRLLRPVRLPHPAPSPRSSSRSTASTSRRARRREPLDDRPRAAGVEVVEQRPDVAVVARRRRRDGRTARLVALAAGDVGGGGHGGGGGGAAGRPRARDAGAPPAAARAERAAARDPAAPPPARARAVGDGEADGARLAERVGVEEGEPRPRPRQRPRARGAAVARGARPAARRVGDAPPAARHALRPRARRPPGEGRADGRVRHGGDPPRGQRRGAAARVLLRAARGPGARARRRERRGGAPPPLLRGLRPPRREHDAGDLRHLPLRAGRRRRLLAALPRDDGARRAAQRAAADAPLRQPDERRAPRARARPRRPPRRRLPRRARRRARRHRARARRRRPRHARAVPEPAVAAQGGAEPDEAVVGRGRREFS